jgi:uncharacterized protein YbbC (DUF1343 family)/CubicO group peptidase (beta-lactamase class C family)
MKYWALLLLAPVVLAQETFSASAALDEEVQQAVKSGLIPGAVLVIGQNGKIVHRKAYGSRALVPAREAMTVDTIFDLASLTKVTATTPAIMRLLEQGKIRITDPVTRYLPEFQGGKSDITVRDLMTHFSGLPPDLDLDPPWSGYQAGVRKALNEKSQNPPGVQFTYSDINFVLLAEIVHRVSGKMLDEFAREEVFEPLGMKETGFKPAASLKPRIAPTEIDPATGQPFRGVVHDETSRFMGGVTGDAGVFSTASDLARYATMLLNGGELDGKQIFSPATIQKFTSPASPPDQPILRGLGWDIDSTYSANRGELYPIGSFGHTGFTGTSMWLDPASKSFVILLTNSVHPRRGKNLASLRGRVATIAAGALAQNDKLVTLNGYNETLESAGGRRMVAANHQVLTGLDVLEERNFENLRGKRVGLITNQTGLDRQGRRNVDVMRAAGVNVVALFSPEHGIAGKEDKPSIGDSKDAATGLPIYSLYEPERRHLSQQQQKLVDVFVFDIQDVGARFYTYSCTLLYTLEDAAKSQISYVVLDRPNPVTGVHVEGPLAEQSLQSFVGCYDMPIRHGLTFGELATMANTENHWGGKLTVVAMKNWQRGDWFDSTGLQWVDPSPNMRSLNAATLYPGVAMIEASKNYSVGRGTDAPFEQIGAEWIKGLELAKFLNSRFVPGVRFYPTRFQPADSNFKGKTIEGVRFVITNRELFSAVRLGLEIANALEKLYPGKIDFEQSRNLIANRKVLTELKAHEDPRNIEQRLKQEDVEKFLTRRKPFLLY